MCGGGCLMGLGGWLVGWLFCSNIIKKKKRRAGFFQCLLLGEGRSRSVGLAFSPPSPGDGFLALRTDCFALKLTSRSDAVTVGSSERRRVTKARIS